MLKITKPSKKALMLALLAGFLIVPTAVNAYTTDTPVESTDIVQNEVITPEEQPVESEVPVEQPEQPVEQPETPDPEVETPVEDPDTPVVDDGVTLAEAQVIAQTEHPNVAIKKVYLGIVEGESVYTFKFVDGWKVSVRATDGLVVELKDPSDNKHGCKNKLKDDPEFQAWLQDRKAQRSGRFSENNEERKHSENNGHRHGRNFRSNRDR